MVDRVTQLGQSLGLDLPDPLPGQRQVQTHLLQRLGLSRTQPEAQHDYLPLPLGEHVEEAPYAVAQEGEHRGVEGIGKPILPDEISQLASLVSHRLVE